MRWPVFPFWALVACAVASSAAEPPWPPQYKLRPDEEDRLTAADVVGPDGLVYPNWTRVGLPDGIPHVPVRARAADCGAAADDDRDDSAAILAAVEKLDAAGGAVLLGPGVYHLDRPIAIRRDNIVLRGEGREKTRIVFRYHLGPTGARWAEPWDSDELFADTTVTFHALPDKLHKLEIYANERLAASRERSLHWGNTFSIATTAGVILRGLSRDATSVSLRGVATYADGAVREQTKTMRIRRDAADPNARRRVGPEAAIGFGGEMSPPKSRRVKLAEDGRRGAMHLLLENTAGLRAGDCLVIEGPMSDRWRSLIRNACLWGTYRRNMLEIAAVDGRRVTITDPLRIEFPVADGAYVQKIDPLRRCGIEDLTIEQTENLWITSVKFNCAWECWARGVTVKKCGRFPVYANSGKRCVIQDCIFDDAWFKGGGGTAYAGWEHSYDCLMANCTTYRLRHAPCVQWSASGNVIRASRFFDSDMQWHSGWTNENLFEQCMVHSQRGNGSYGHAAWASPPDDKAHGPNGPRNVIYNCDLGGQKAGIWLGGMNEAWMILYNRIAAADGEGLYVKTTSFDHVIRGNAFSLGKAGAPAIMLASADCTGMEIYDNVVLGGRGAVCVGKSAPLVERDNRILPAGASPPAAQGAVPSIYLWQRAHAKQRRTN